MKYANHIILCESKICLYEKLLFETRKTAGTAENPARQQTPFCDIQMVVLLLLANISIPYRYPTTENLSDLDFELSRSVNVKFDNAIGLAT